MLLLLLSFPPIQWRMIILPILLLRLPFLQSCFALPFLRENMKTLSLGSFPKCNLDVHLLSFFRHEWANKGVIYIFTIIKAKWTHYVFPPCPKGVWFKLSFYKVFPVLIHTRCQRFVEYIHLHLSSRGSLFTLLLVIPNIARAYFITKGTHS